MVISLCVYSFDSSFIYLLFIYLFMYYLFISLFYYCETIDMDKILALSF